MFGAGQGEIGSMAALASLDPAFNPSASGFAGPYTYLWSRISGDANFGVVDATQQNGGAITGIDVPFGGTVGPWLIAAQRNLRRGSTPSVTINTPSQPQTAFTFPGTRQAGAAICAYVYELAIAPPMTINNTACVGATSFQN